MPALQRNGLCNLLLDDTIQTMRCWLSLNLSNSYRLAVT